MASSLSDGILLGTTIVGGLLRGVLSMSPKNMRTRRTQNINKHTLSFPVLITDDIPMETRVEITKALEVQTALEIKTLFEAMVYYNPFTGLSLESSIKKAQLDKVDKDAMLDLYQFVADKHKGGKSSAFFEDITVDVINGAFAEGSSGLENIDVRNAYPTFLSVSVKAVVGASVETIDYTLAVKCSPKVVPTSTMKEVLMYPALYNKEVNKKLDMGIMLDWKGMKGIFNSRTPVKKHKSSEMATILKRISKNSSGPYINFVLSSEFVDDMKSSNGYDIYDKHVYKSLMTSLPIMSISVLDLDADIMEITYDREKPLFDKYSLEDFFNDTAKYEKELRSVIKYNKYS